MPRACLARPDVAKAQRLLFYPPPNWKTLALDFVTTRVYAAVLRFSTLIEEVPLRVQGFKVGEKVVYPAHGVGVIEDVRLRKLSSGEQKFYTLRIIDSDMKIMIPTAKAESVGLRRVIGKEMVTKVYKVLREKRVRVDQATWNRRYREYTEKIKTGSVLEIAAVLRDLFVLKGDKELSFGERKMLDTARNLLVKELAIAKSNSEEKIMEELKTIFGH